MNETDHRVSALVVDDEPLARSGLCQMLAEIEWIHCVGVAANGLAAVTAIDTLQPELVFLDIHMPGIHGMEVLARVTHQPFVVFTTAHAEHAVTAFELGALDYLLKPFGEERLRATLDRVRAVLGEPLAPSLARFGEAMNHTPISRLFVRSGRNIVPIAVCDIVRFEAVGDYIAAHVDGTQHLLHLPLGHLERRLDAERFTRIHRSHIVNLDHVAAFRGLGEGTMVAHLSDGTCLPVSRTKAREIRVASR